MAQSNKNYFPRCALGVYAFAVLFWLPAHGWAQQRARLPGVKPLLANAGDLALQRKQVFDYFERQIEAARIERDKSWQADLATPAARKQAFPGRRADLRKMLGLTVSKFDPSAVKISRIAQQDRGYRIERVSIPIESGLVARGLLLTPAGRGKKPAVIVCPNATTWPERLAALDQIASQQQHASGRPDSDRDNANDSDAAMVSSLLANGSIVYIAQSVERLVDHPYCAKTRGKDRRAILYRLGYVVGRTMPGIDVQDTLAAIDFLSAHKGVIHKSISLTGRGQGGMTALMTAALDERIATTTVTDYFDQRSRCWAEPVDRRLRDQLLHFGDAELAALVAPRLLTIRLAPEFARETTAFEAVAKRAARYYHTFGVGDRFKIELIKKTKPQAPSVAKDGPASNAAMQVRNRHFEERLRWLRRQVDASEEKRYARWNILGRPSKEFPQIRKEMLGDYRQMVGSVPDDGTPMKVRRELALETDKYRAYRVTIDTVQGVSVYGNLLIPSQIEGHRPAVICQHGFGGSPEKITGIGMKKDTVYHEYGRKLAERGYVVLAPMLMHYAPSQEVSRQMRQANTVGMMRLAMPIAKTNRVIDFLASLDVVDPERIGYYGLSYGGYSAIWMTPLIDRLAVSVISGNFNDWRTKITSDELNTSYLRHPDEDMYSWNCLNRFTHPELIAMMFPRPVCVEFGRRDGITTSAWTEYAWKQTSELSRHLNQTDRVILAEFDGAHEIRGEETFAFLDRFLWPDRSKSQGK